MKYEVIYVYSYPYYLEFLIMQQQKLFFPCKQDRFMHSFKHSSYLERVMFEVGMISRWGWQVPMNWLGQSPSSLYPPPEGTGYTWTYYSSV